MRPRKVQSRNERKVVRTELDDDGVDDGSDDEKETIVNDQEIPGIATRRVMRGFVLNGVLGCSPDDQAEFDR